VCQQQLFTILELNQCTLYRRYKGLSAVPYGYLESDICGAPDDICQLLLAHILSRPLSLHDTSNSKLTVYPYANNFKGVPQEIKVCWTKSYQIMFVALCEYYIFRCGPWG
jgi:hypothetical protein